MSQVSKDVRKQIDRSDWNKKETFQVTDQKVYMKIQVYNNNNQA